MDSANLNFRVAGMVQRGGFVWSGCPDAVRAAVIALPGVREVAYDDQKDLFTVRFDSQQTRVEDIFAAVYLAGRQSGQEYLPQLISWGRRPGKRGSGKFRPHEGTSLKRLFPQSPRTALRPGGGFLSPRRGSASGKPIAPLRS
jgi:hypothetical protein